MRLGALTAVAAGALALLVGGGSASAATFGADLTQTPGYSTHDLTLTNVIDQGGATDPGSPTSGILTSVRMKTTGAAGSGILHVIRLVSRPDASTYTFRNVGPDIPVMLAADATSAGHTTTVATRQPIAAGDRLSWQTADTTGTIRENALDATAECGYTHSSHNVGTNLDYTTASCNHNILLAAGTVEPDADGDGYGDLTQDQCPTDPATQAPCPAPTIAGLAQVGETLHATPNGTPMSPTYQWLRCDASGGACAAIAGPTGLAYTLTAADQGHTLRFRKTATNSSATQTGDSAPTLPVAAAAFIPPAPPVASGVSMQRRRFRVAALATPVVATRAKRGSAFRYTLDRPATVTIKIYAVTSGRKSKGRCSPRGRGRRRCALLVLKGTLTRSGRVGRNTVPFSGRIGRRALRPGRYRASIVATNGGGSSTPSNVAFTIVR